MGSNIKFEPQKLKLQLDKIIVLTNAQNFSSSEFIFHNLDFDCLLLSAVFYFCCSWFNFPLQNVLHSLYNWFSRLFFKVP